VRRRAIAALGELGPDARMAATALIQLLSDENTLLRRWAAAALGEIGPTAPSAIPALIEALRENDVKNRAVTAAALQKMGSRAVPRLIEALRHADANVRRHAAQTLSKNPAGREAVPILRELVCDPDVMVAEAACDALRRLAAPIAVREAAS
jgi:HEAT repeat protein